MASPEQEKSGKKSLGARMKALFKKSSKNPIPAQQVVSQTPHYASSWQPPAPPDDGLLERHLQRMASLDNLPQVQTYLNFDRQVVRVAHGSATSFEAFRQQSSETKDTWERSALMTQATSSRATSGKRLTMLMEDEVAHPSSSAGQVGILSKLKNFEEPVQNFTNQDPRRHASGLARALKERQLEDDRDHESDNETDENSSVIHWRGHTRDGGYHGGTSRSRRESSPPMSNISCSGSNVQHWSQQPTIRRVSSSPQEGMNYNAQSHIRQVQGPVSNKTPSISPATESVYSKDEDRIPIWRTRASASPDQVARGSPQTVQGARRKNITHFNEVFGDFVANNRDRAGQSIVDYYSGEPSPSVARSSISANLNLAYPRGNTDQNTPFPGATNDRLQLVPPHFSLIDFISTQQMPDAREAMRQPSLAELREQIRKEDAAQLARMQSENYQARSTSPAVTNKSEKERINIDCPYPPWRSSIYQESHGIAGSTSYQNQARQSQSEQILIPRDLNRSQLSIASSRERAATNSERTVHPRPSQQETTDFNEMMHAHGLRRRSRSSEISALQARFRSRPINTQDLFLQDQDGNVWASRSSSRVQEESGTASSRYLQQSAFGPSRVLPRKRAREIARAPENIQSSEYPYQGANTQGDGDGGKLTKEWSREPTDGPAFI